MVVRYYDASGRRVPAPRHDFVPSNASAVVVALIAIALMMGFAAWAYTSNLETAKDAGVRAERPITHDSMSIVHTYDGEEIRFYVMTDPDTGVQYIVNDRGGMCPREGIDAT